MTRKEPTAEPPIQTLPPPSTVRGQASDATLAPPVAPPQPAAEADSPAAGSPGGVELLGSTFAYEAAPPPANPELAPTIAPAGAQGLAEPSVETLEQSQSAMTLAPNPDAAPILMPNQPTGIQTGASFGDYQVIETIAKGGMGIVFKARQRKLNRIVAIKMILAGQFADRADVERFYTEAEAAAALSHPNIVRIYEIGEVQGQHFFSMEYIEGHSLADLVRENPLAPRRAAEVVRTIAETMQFAHEKGIVHRDLKPSNVLVDAQQRPLITDFGLAKHQENESQLTVSGAVIGTPSYMPPEQAEGKGSLIGPRSDLYSLGAILYELVTGRPPFRAASPFETIRQVIQDEPLSPRLVNPGVPMDLETICLKCLQKDPARRYATSQDLADELGRFLRGEPILARPIGSLARLWRLCRRYPVAASAIAAAVLLLVTTAVVSTSASIVTARALAASEQSLRDAMQVVEDFLTKVSEDTLLNQPGLQPVRRELLEKALAYYQKFLRQRANDPRVQRELAGAMFRVGQITELLESPDKALPSYEEARTMQTAQLARRPGDPELLKALGNTLNAIGTVRVKQKEYDAARQEYREAIAVRQRLASADPSNGEYQRVLANTCMNLGLAAFNAGAQAAAREQLDESQRIRAAALAASPPGETELKLRCDLGKGHFSLGNLAAAGDDRAAAIAEFTAAVAEFERVVAVRPEDLDNQKLLATCYRRLGDLQGDQPEVARRWYSQALARLTPLARKNPDVVDYQTEQAGIYMNLAGMELDAGNAGAGLAALASARDILQPLADRYPQVPRYQRDLAVTLRELAVEQDAAGKKGEARQNLARAIQLLELLAAKYPQDQQFAAELKIASEIALAK
jgi:tRNA A-37 threonylcarbamoyl transferase component Bud32/tetratricopeptide (TPR) repeat protein